MNAFASANRGAVSQNVTQKPPLPRERPLLFLNPGSQNYNRDKSFLLRMYQGSVLVDSARIAGMSSGAAWNMMCRLRKKAAAWAGCEISDVTLLRLLFDREQAEADLKLLQQKRSSLPSQSG